MRVKSNKLALRVLSTATFLAMVSSCATAAFAGTYYMEDGSISIVAKTDGNYITQGDINDKKDEGETVITNRNSSTASENTVTIKAEEDCTANVTLDNVNIDASDTGKAAIHTEGNVTLELDGDNTLTGGTGHAGLEKNDNTGNGTLIIKDDKNDDGTEKTEEQKKAETESGKGAGSLTATGGAGGAGIGGGKSDNSSRSGQGLSITIQDGAHVEATGGEGGAGIGGGSTDVSTNSSGLGSQITITGDGTYVKATGGTDGAGIGGGKKGQGQSVTIDDAATAIASGTGGGAGIGGGSESRGCSLFIQGGDITATGGAEGGSGIGGGSGKVASIGKGGSGVTISGGTVNATGGAGAAGIGSGANSDYSKGSYVTITDGTVTANGGAGAAGIGDGANNVAAADSVISITGGTVTANGGAGEAAGIGNGENDAGVSTVKLSATTAKLDITAMTLGSGEAITGENGVTMASLTNVLSGVVRFFRGTNHYNTVHNGKYVGMDDNNADEHQETDAHIWGSTEIIRQATPTEQGILRHHCAVDGCKGYYEEFFDYVAPAEPVTPAPTDPDTPDVPGTSDSTPGTPAQGTPADAATADAVPGAATAEEVSVTPSGAQTVTAAALPKTGVNWLAAVGSAISGMVLLAAGYVLDRKSRRQN